MTEMEMRYVMNTLNLLKFKQSVRFTFLFLQKLLHATDNMET